MKLSRRAVLQTALALGTGITARVSASQPLLGLISPPPSTASPPEALALYGSSLRFSVFGLGLASMTPAGYDGVIDKIVPGAKQLAKNGADALVIFGTSLTFYRGAAFNRKLIDDVKRATGLKTTSMSSAVVDGLNAVGGRRIAVATAYADEVNGRLGLFLKESGFEVLQLKGLGLERIGEAEQVTQKDLHAFCTRVYRSAPGADALLVSCGGLSTLDLIAPLEADCGVPVISSTPHALWGGMRLLDASIKASAYGTLLARG